LSILNYETIRTSDQISKNLKILSRTPGGIESDLGGFSMKLMSENESFLCLPHLTGVQHTENRAIYPPSFQKL